MTAEPVLPVGADQVKLICAELATVPDGVPGAGGTTFGTLTVTVFVADEAAGEYALVLA